MTSVYIELLKLLIPLGTVGVVFTLLLIHDRYDAVLKPLIGLLLWRKPLLRKNLDAFDLFRVGNHGHRVKTTADVKASMERLIYTIDKRSWFKKHDLRLLKKYYKEVYESIRMQEELERIKQNGQRQQRENRRASDKKAESQAAWWRTVLGVSANEKDPKVIKLAYRKACSKDHPDKGGTGKKMPDLNRALEAARKELNFV